tara:strand:- start:1432 stop:1644 length:213 start_codon:yes stop_codon:yes gene_type:complete
MRKTANIIIKPRGREHQDRMIKRFIRKCKKEKIIEQIRDRRYYKKPSERKREKERRRKALIEKEKRKNRN